MNKRRTINTRLFKMGDNDNYIQVDNVKKNIRNIDDKAHTLLATSHKGAMANGMTIVDNGNFRIRRLTPTECARLQTVPEWYVWDGISDTQRYKMLGNGWNIETIKHIFKYLRR